MLLIRKSAPLFSLEKHRRSPHKEVGWALHALMANNWAQKTKALHVSKNVKQLLSQKKSDNTQVYHRETHLC